MPIKPGTLGVALVAIAISAPAQRSATSRSQPVQTWTVAAPPELLIGGAAGTGPTEFAKIVGVSRTPQGEWVVANAATNEVRVFSAAGQHVRTLSRTGDGPAEFRSLSGVEARGAAIIAWGRSRSATEFGVNGPVRHTIAPTPGRMLMQTIGVLRDRSLVAVATMGRSPVRRDGRVADSLLMLRSRSGGVVFLDSIPIFEREFTAGEPAMIAFSPAGVMVAQGGTACYGWSAGGTVWCHRETGARFRIDVPRSERRPTKRDEEGWRIAFRAHNGPRRGPETEEQLRMLRLSPRFPAFSQLLLDADTLVWVREFSARDGWPRVGELGLHDPSPAEPTRWRVMSHTNRLIARIELPVRFQPYEIGPGYVAGVQRDDDDVEAVAVYSLRRR